MRNSSLDGSGRGFLGMLGSTLGHATPMLHKRQPSATVRVPL